MVNEISDLPYQGGDTTMTDLALKKVAEEVSFGGPCMDLASARVCKAEIIDIHVLATLHSQYLRQRSKILNLLQFTRTI